MNGVIQHGDTVRWLYSLLGSKYRLVQKTALKLLLVFVEYAESNCELLVEAIESVDKENREKPWTNVMKILNEKDPSDPELIVFAMTLINMVRWVTIHEKELAMFILNTSQYFAQVMSWVCFYCR